MKDMPKILVLGGSSGIGYAVVKLFRSENYAVTNVSRSPCKIAGVKNISIDLFKKNFDLSIINDVSVVVDCIGMNIPAGFEVIDDNDIDRMFEVNIKSKFRAFRQLLQTNDLSHIVIVSSIWGVSARKGRSVYGATKFALMGLVKTLALEYAQKNCLVNAVSPGFTLTDLTARTNSEEELKEIESNIPLNRLAKPIEIARLIKFLTSDMNTYISGQNIIIDGGFTI